MKNLIIGLKARSVSDCPSIKFVSTYNGQDKELEEGKGYSFPLPALFFEFVNENQVDCVGGGAQVYDPLDIKFHLIHDFYNNNIGTLEENLDVYDIESEIFAAFQLFMVKGADFGSSALNRVSTERDYDHSNVYHSINTYRTTWTDNSQLQPIGGYEINPPLLTNITPQIIPVP